MKSLHHFVGGEAGPWRIIGIHAIRGAGLAPASRLAVLGPDDAPPSGSPAWCLRGLVSNLRYATRSEVADLASLQPTLARPAATHAALIPIRKEARWWAMAQDERRAVFEEASHHTAIGLEYLPEVARRLHHARDLGEPFDFLTWFEYAPEHEAAFDALVARLRATPEWDYVEREVDIRLTRDRALVLD